MSTQSIRAAHLTALTGALLLALIGIAAGPADAAPPGPDTTPPAATASVQRNLLWPARGAMMSPGFTGSAIDDCDGALEAVVRIYSDQPNGAAPFSPDATGTTGIPASLRLRAERAYPTPPGTFGRVYIVSVSGTDTAGNTGAACTSVTVPLFPVGQYVVGTRAKALVGEALCTANGGVIPAGNGYTLLFTFTLPPPIKAVNDSYDTLGNVRMTVPAANGVLANDLTITPPLTVTSAGTFTSANNGNVTLATDGSFTYDPPVGFEGTDTFTYTIQDGAALTATATVSITVSEVIWFIDNTAAAGGDGRQVTPFNSFAAYTTTAADDPGDIIHVDLGGGTSSGYDAGLGLLANQQLIGEGVALATGAGLTVPPYNTLPGAGTRPVLDNPTGDAVTAVGGNVIRGLSFSDPSGSSILASGAGLTLSEIDITGSAVGVRFNGVSGTVDVDNVDVLGPSNTGFELLSCSASFDFDSACSASWGFNQNLVVQGGTCSLVYNGDLDQQGSGGLVRVDGNHSTGTLTFQNGTVGCTTGTGIALGPCTSNITFAEPMSLTTTSDAITFSSASGVCSFNNLTITSAGRGMTGTASGPVNVTGTNSIAAVGGAAIDFANTSLGATFSSITSTSGTHGIRLATCSGSFAVTGLTDVDTPTGDGISVATSPTLDVDFAAIDIDGGTARGIGISGGVGDFDVTGPTTVDGTASWGIEISTSAGDTFTFTDTDVGLTTPCVAGVDVQSSTGAAFTFADLDVTTSGGVALRAHTAGTLDIGAAPALNATGGAAIVIVDTNGGTNGTGNFEFAAPVSTNSPDVGILFSGTSEIILLTDVDIDSNTTSITRGIEMTDCSGTSKTVRRGHIVFTGTNDGFGVLVQNSDDVTIEGDTTSAFDPIGTPGVFTGAFEMTGMGTGSVNTTLNGNTHGHHAVCCHDSNGLTVQYCYIHDIGDTGNADASLDAGVYIDETTGGTVTVTMNHFEDIIGADALHIGSPASLFTNTSTFDFTFNRVVGNPAATPVSTETAVQAAFDSTSAATIICNFDDNLIQGTGFDGINCQVDMNVGSGNSGTSSRNLFSASDNTIQDPDNNAIQFDFGDQSHSRLICENNLLDASVSHTSFQFGPQIGIEVEIAHDGTTFTPEVDVFIENNTIQSTNTGTQNWIDQGVRVQTSSASGAGVGTIRALIAENDISHCEDNAIEVQADESNAVNAIIRDNTIDSSNATGIGSGGVIELDTQSNSDASVLIVWLDGNETGTPPVGVPGYFVEEHPAPVIDLACEGVCPVSGTIVTNTDLVTLLSHNGNTSAGGGTPTVDAGVGSVDVVTTGSVPSPTVRAAGSAKRLAGYTLVGETDVDKDPILTLLAAAKTRWIDAGLNAFDRRILDSITVGVADLEGDVLAKTWITHITLDAKAAGFGWFVDATPEDDREFSAAALRAAGSAARGRMDLLTVLLHEIGHALGREHCRCPDHVMSHALTPGVRRLP